VEEVFNRIKRQWKHDQSPTTYDNDFAGFQWFVYRHMKVVGDTFKMKKREQVSGVYYLLP